MPDKRKKITEWIKRHPSALIAAAGILGVSGETVTELATLPIPGWVLGLLLIIYAAATAVREHLDTQEALKNEVRELKDALNGRLDALVEEVTDIRTGVKRHSERLGLLAAEQAAHREALERASLIDARAE